MESKNPIERFTKWYDLATKTETIKEPFAMTLATINSSGHPSARMVALEGFSEDGFKFNTNLNSVKAQQLASTPYAALVFYWGDLGASVRIEGCVKKYSEEENIQSFSGLPRPIQVLAHASTHQSSPLDSMDKLTSLVQSIDQKNKEHELSRPDYWGGYFVVPDRIEFYKLNDLHIADRTLFVRKESGPGPWMQGENGWVYQKLQP
uniref:pyridoxal 5'-phosphate synthase n=1 Tax=Phallusia mammillata TaxID=59560 RepID=A0A6F9DNH8_9ASCI|nr:pyridoxine-5'-phosphate oxidase-like [Phallusia mammillata]